MEFRGEGRRENSLPIINRLVRSQQDQIQTLQHVPLLNCASQEQIDSIKECGKGLVEHQFVRRGERADDDKSKVDDGTREDDVWWKRVDLAYIYT